MRGTQENMDLLWLRDYKLHVSFTALLLEGLPWKFLNITAHSLEISLAVQMRWEDERIMMTKYMCCRSEHYDDRVKKRLAPFIEDCVCFCPLFIVFGILPGWLSHWLGLCCVHMEDHTLPHSHGRIRKLAAKPWLLWDFSIQMLQRWASRPQTEGPMPRLLPSCAPYLTAQQTLKET